MNLGSLHTPRATDKIQVLKNSITTGNLNGGIWTDTSTHLIKHFRPLSLTTHLLNVSMGSTHGPAVAMPNFHWFQSWLYMQQLQFVGDTATYVPMDEVAEWLRRWTANPLCSACMGSNPILIEQPKKSVIFYGTPRFWLSQRLVR